MSVVKISFMPRVETFQDWHAACGRNAESAKINIIHKSLMVQIVVGVDIRGQDIRNSAVTGFDTTIMSPNMYPCAVLRDDSASVLVVADDFEPCHFHADSPHGCQWVFSWSLFSHSLKS